MKQFDGFQKGVNLGGWISQFAEYDRHHFESFIGLDDIKNIAQLGFDHVRVPVDYNVLETENGEFLESGFGYLENCRKWCMENGLHMIIDLHECYGYSFDPLKKNMDRKKFFYEEALQDRFLKLWSEIARRFRDTPEVVAFEPLNEVVLFEVADAWNALLEKYFRTVRAIAPENYIIMGGVCYNHVSTVRLLPAPFDERTVYNFHCYEPLIFTHQGAYWQAGMPLDFRIGYPKTAAEYREASKTVLGETDGAVFDYAGETIGPEFFQAIFAPAVEAAEKYDVPLYCGEYGVIDLADNDDKIRWLKDIHTAFAAYGIGHALWNYKEKDFGFVNDRFASVREEFIACL